MNKQDRLNLMGQVVTVQAELRKWKLNRRVEWTRTPVSSRSGWVVGFRWVRNGTVDVVDYGIDGRPIWSFIPTKSIPAVLVSYWPTHAPVHVPLDGFAFGGPKPTSGQEWNDLDRKVQAEYSSAQRRDDKGRFTK